ncbi:MAG: ATP-binding cassette domain-containing protein [Kiloniellales bacterium]
MLSVQDLARPGLGPISFELDNGECIAVRGPSGAGKSLVLRAIADLDPNSGSVTLDGHAREAMPAPQWRRLVTYLPAEPGWWAESVGAHYPDWDKAVSLVEALGLPADCDDWPVLRLSTGERQRLGLVRVLLLEPRVLLLDEPTSGLDEVAAESVERLVVERLAQGAAALWVTHDEAQARRLARRALAISKGQAQEVPP